jgi:hypothetical protein
MSRFLSPNDKQERPGVQKLSGKDLASFTGSDCKTLLSPHPDLGPVRGTKKRRGATGAPRRESHATGGESRVAAHLQILKLVADCRGRKKVAT